MESSSDKVRIKEEPNDSWLDAGDDNVSGSVDFREVKNVSTLPLYKSSVEPENEAVALQERLDQKIFIDVECKNVKLELKSLPMTVCISENQSSQPIVKKENENPSDNMNDKSLIILIKKGFDYYNNCQWNQNFRLKLANCEKLRNCEKTDEKKSLYASEICQESNTTTASKKSHTNTILEWNRTYECDFCPKSFGYKSYLKTHIKTVHNHFKPFECKICHKSFGHKCNLKVHINTIHVRSKPFECDICHSSFGDQSNFNRHINLVHNRNKPFECDICHKSFGRKAVLKTHIIAVHDRSKPFECNNCHKSFGYRHNLKRHLNECSTY